MVITIKREGETQDYDSRKVYASVYNSSLNAHQTDNQAEALADKVEKKITLWVKNHSHVNSHQIKNQVIKELINLNEKDVALLYKHHLDVN